jgi:hypothetical protein
MEKMSASSIARAGPKRRSSGTTEIITPPLGGPPSMSSSGRRKARATIGHFAFSVQMQSQQVGVPCRPPALSVLLRPDFYDCRASRRCHSLGGDGGGELHLHRTSVPPATGSHGTDRLIRICDPVDD